VNIHEQEYCIRSRTDVALKNEALCKLLAYNITSVIHSQCELGIEPIFWAKLEGEERNLLPLVRPSERQVNKYGYS
jgi:hypothetical protein